MTKTCGNCKHLNRELAFCRACGARWMREEQPCCDNFEAIQPITNGDKIIAGGMRAIAEFAVHHCCQQCIYFDGNNPYRHTCGKPDGKTCVDGVEAWLNAPAESEGEDE